MIISFILNFLTIGLYSQYLKIMAPIGFQYPNSISFNDIIDFHDYIIIFLVFIFVIVIWHLFWAVNLYNVIFNIIYFHSVINYYFDYIKESKMNFAFFNILNIFHSNLNLMKQKNLIFFVEKECKADSEIVWFLFTTLVQLNANRNKTHFHKILYQILFFTLQIVLFVFFTKKQFPSFETPKFDQQILISFIISHVRREKTKTKTIIHAPSLEIFWTIFPSFILLAIAIPSLILLYQLDAVEPLSLCIKVIGHQWYWTYEIGSSIGLFQDYIPSRKVKYATSFDSYMLPNETSHLRLLEVDNPLFVPVGVPLTFLVTSTDVIHSWAIPSLGIKVDAIPGRLNQVCVTILSPGIFYGQCSELCGVNHGFMPINIIAYNEVPF